MTYTPNKSAPKIAIILRKAIIDPGISFAQLAKECGVTRQWQSVNGWLKTGQIDKEHFPTIQRPTGLSLTTLVSGGELDVTDYVVSVGDKFTVPVVAKGSMGQGLQAPT